MLELPRVLVVHFSRAIHMGIPKGPTEGGSGGKRGHSGMEHWGFTEEVKKAARKRRRLDDKKVIRDELNVKKRKSR